MNYISRFLFRCMKVRSGTRCRNVVVKIVNHYKTISVWVSELHQLDDMDTALHCVTFRGVTPTLNTRSGQEGDRADWYFHPQCNVAHITDDQRFALWRLEVSSDWQLKIRMIKIKYFCRWYLVAIINIFSDRTDDRYIMLNDSFFSVEHIEAAASQ